jgi:transitional endoplasmic reticulum ATPase
MAPSEGEAQAAYMAMKIVKPSINPQMLKEYEKISEVLRSSERPLTMFG